MIHPAHTLCSKMYPLLDTLYYCCTNGCFSLTNVLLAATPHSNVPTSAFLFVFAERRFMNIFSLDRGSCVSVRQTTFSFLHTTSLTSHAVPWGPTPEQKHRVVGDTKAWKPRTTSLSMGRRSRLPVTHPTSVARFELKPEMRAYQHCSTYPHALLSWRS